MSKTDKSITDQMAEGGYDALYVPGDCACSMDDLCPCGEMSVDCVMGYKNDCETCGKREECPDRMHGIDWIGSGNRCWVKPLEVS